MMRSNAWILIGLSAAMLMPGRVAGQTLPVELKVSDETIPPGATVQLKILLTEPRPIMTGTGSFAMDERAFDSFYGISLNSPGGDTFGVASYGKGQFSIAYVSPLGTFGTVVDYPILTVAARVSASALPGSRSLITLGAGSFSNPLGQTLNFVQNRPGVLTVGGKLSIHNVLPGGGTWGPGTVLKVVGTGFIGSGTKIVTKFRTRSARVISDSEIELVLDRETALDAQQITVSQRDRVGTTTQVTYFSYLRGVNVSQSTFGVVATAIPVFPLVNTLQARVMQSGPGLNGGTLTALSLQNPSPTAVTVELTASNAFGRIARTSVTLAYGEKITRELGEFFGQDLPIGTVVKAEALTPLQVVPFLADQVTGVLTPFAAF